MMPPILGRIGESWPGAREHLTAEGQPQPEQSIAEIQREASRHELVSLAREALLCLRYPDGVGAEFKASVAERLADVLSRELRS